MATMLRFRYSRSFAQRTSAPRSASIRGTDEHVPLQTSSLSKPRHGLLIKEPVRISRYPGNGHASWPIPVLLPASFRRSSSPFSPHYLFLVSLFL
jgi:hypothetical protein